MKLVSFVILLADFMVHDSLKMSSCVTQPYACAYKFGSSTRKLFSVAASCSLIFDEFQLSGQLW